MIDQLCIFGKCFIRFIEGSIKIQANKYILQLNRIQMSKNNYDSRFSYNFSSQKHLNQKQSHPSHQKTFTKAEENIDVRKTIKLSKAFLQDIAQKLTIDSSIRCPEEELKKTKSVQQIINPIKQKVQFVDKLEEINKKIKLIKSAFSSKKKENTNHMEMNNLNKDKNAWANHSNKDLLKQIELKRKIKTEEAEKELKKVKSNNNSKLQNNGLYNKNNSIIKLVKCEYENHDEHDCPYKKKLNQMLCYQLNQRKQEEEIYQNKQVNSKIQQKQFSNNLEGYLQHRKNQSKNQSPTNLPTLRWNYDDQNYEEIKMQEFENHEVDIESVDTYDQELGQEYEMPRFAVESSLRKTANPTQLIQHINNIRQSPNEAQKNVGPTNCPSNPSKWYHESAGNKLFQNFHERHQHLDEVEELLNQKQTLPKQPKIDQSQELKQSLSLLRANKSTKQPEHLKVRKIVSIDTFQSLAETKSIDISNVSEKFSFIGTNQKREKHKIMKQKLDEVLIKSKKAIEMLKNTNLKNKK